MRVFITFATLFAISIFASTVNAQAVLFEGTGNYYELVSENVTWEEAEALAGVRTLFGVQGHLVTLTSQEENEFLLDTFGGLSGWIGLSQEPGSVEPGGGFGWVTDEALEFTSFGGVEPNNAFGDEQFVEFFNGNWNDLGPTSNRRYYVEFETAALAVPEPSSLFANLILISCFLGLRRRK